MPPSSAAALLRLAGADPRDSWPRIALSARDRLSPRDWNPPEHVAVEVGGASLASGLRERLLGRPEHARASEQVQKCPHPHSDETDNEPKNEDDGGAA